MSNGRGQLRGLDGRVAIVTGGTSGIGRETARLLGSDGARLVISGRSAERGADVVSDLRQTGVQVVFVQADLRKAADIEGLVARCLEEFGSLDILINSGGVNVREGLDGPSEEDWDLLFSTNVKGTWLCCRAALPYLIKSRGAIVNLASLAGMVGVASSVGYGSLQPDDPPFTESTPLAPNSPYAASKAAVINLTKSLALAYADQGLRVNAVCPGPVETAMTHGSWAAVGEDSGRRLARAMCPVRRLATPPEIAGAVRFLAACPVTDLD